MKIYTSIEEVPLDEWNGVDHEDQASPVAASPMTEQREGVIATTPTGTFVPFVRVIKMGTTGKDVFAVTRALSLAGYGKWGWWTSKTAYVMGFHKVELVKKFQMDRGLKADGIYGKETHSKLARFFDDYGIWLLGHTKVLSSNDVKRNLIAASAMLGYRYRFNIHYTQSSYRMQGVRHRIMPPNYPVWEDCSSFATWCYWTAKAPDPNGLGYNGQGYTGTQINHGRSVRLDDALKGDLVFYGWRSGIPTHVAIYVGSGRVVSHGSEVGPLLLMATYRSITAIRRYF